MTTSIPSPIEGSNVPKLGLVIFDPDHVPEAGEPTKLKGGCEGHTI